MRVALPLCRLAPRARATNTGATTHAHAVPEWRSYSGLASSKGRDEFIGQAKGFRKVMPDLTWNIKVSWRHSRLVCAVFVCGVCVCVCV